MIHQYALAVGVRTRLFVSPQKITITNCTVVTHKGRCQTIIMLRQLLSFTTGYLVNIRFRLDLKDWFSSRTIFC